eukprot:3493262-Rhodomonas_salina.1
MKSVSQTEWAGFAGRQPTHVHVSRCRRRPGKCTHVTKHAAGVGTTVSAALHASSPPAAATGLVDAAHCQRH